MTLGVMGRKVGMTQVFDENGLAVPVTVVKLGENIVTETKTKEKHGYVAVQVGGFAIKEKKLNKPDLGAFKKKEIQALKPLKEYRVEVSVIIEDNGISGKEKLPANALRFKKSQSYGISLVHERINSYNKAYGRNISFKIIQLNDSKGEIAGTRIVLEF